MQAPAAAVGRPLPSHLEKAFARVTEIATLPEITTRIVQMVEDPKATAHDMHEIIRTDPALAAKILKVVNSAFYGLPAQIASLDRAILMLGLSAVKNIALAASLSRLFRPDAINDHFAARYLWRHCVAVGVCARLVATAARFAQADEAFVGGLMHDIGLIVVQQLFPGKLREIAQQLQRRPQQFTAIEEATVGATHEDFGGALAAKWRFPPGLQHAIAQHHAPEQVTGECARMTTIIYVADTLCCELRLGFWLTGQAQRISDEQVRSIGLPAAALAQIKAELPARVQEAEEIFKD